MQKKVIFYDKYGLILASITDSNKILTYSDRYRVSI